MRINRPLLFLCILCSLVTVYASALPAGESASNHFVQGNSEYQRGNYTSAEQHYSRILRSGAGSGPLYYNLGNACFKQRRLGEAIYYWEKAKQNLPGDREIQENLELANLMIVDRIEIPADPLPIKILLSAGNLLTVAQESLLVLILFVVANALFSAYLLAKNRRHASRALIGCFAFGFLFLIFASSLSWKIYDRNYRKEGIVIEGKVDVRSGPGTENIAVFTIHEGIKVRVLGSTDGWCQISLPNGWSGWLNQSCLRIL
jgi:tetratricopeptide (TPR) repeat protein